MASALPQPGLLRLAIIVGLIALLCFLTAILAASRRDQPGDGLDAPLLARFGDLLARKGQVKTSELQLAPGSNPGCRLAADELIIPRTVTCNLTVATANTPVRTLALTVRTGTGSAVLRRQGGLQERLPLTLGQTSKLDVFKEGGAVALACQGTADCRVALR